MQRMAIYPGTFDPVTLGHLDIIKRSLGIFDILIVAIAEDSNKNTLLTLDQRLDLLRQEIKNIQDSKEGKTIEIVSFKGLLVNFAKERGIKLITRGLRSRYDFDFEFQLFSVNKQLDPELETIYLPSTLDFVSSTFVREIYKLKGSLTNFVTENTAQRLKEWVGYND